MDAFILIGILLFLGSPLLALYGAKQVKKAENKAERRKGLLILFVSCITVTIGFVALMLFLRGFM